MFLTQNVVFHPKMITSKFLGLKRKLRRFRETGPCFTNSQLRAATDESQKTLNKCETRNKTVFDTRLRHPETINSVPLNSVLRIKQTCV